MPNPFSSFINALYVDGVISGYTCGGVGEPCVAPNNRPYYRPSNGVTRAQMAKFVENGRRNIDQAIGESLVLSTTFPNTPLIARTSYGFGEAVDATCLSPGPCFAVRGHADQDGNWAGYFGSDGEGGVYAEQDDDNGSAVRGVSRGIDAEAGYFHAYGANSYAGYFESDSHRGIYASGDPNFYGLYMNTAGSPYSAYFDGDITVTGNCLGCAPILVVQNVGDSALEAGNLVSLVGNGPAVLGDSPVLLVRKATGPYRRGRHRRQRGLCARRGHARRLPGAGARPPGRPGSPAAGAGAGHGRRDEDGPAGDPDAGSPDQRSRRHRACGQRPGEHSRARLRSRADERRRPGAESGRGPGRNQAGDLLVSSPTPGYAMKADATW